MLGRLAGFCCRPYADACSRASTAQQSLPRTPAMASAVSCMASCEWGGRASACMTPQRVPRPSRPPYSGSLMAAHLGHQKPSHPMRFSSLKPTQRCVHPSRSVSAQSCRLYLGMGIHLLLRLRLSLSTRMCTDSTQDESLSFRLAHVRSSTALRQSIRACLLRPGARRLLCGPEGSMVGCEVLLRRRAPGLLHLQLVGLPLLGVGPAALECCGLQDCTTAQPAASDLGHPAVVARPRGLACLLHTVLCLPPCLHCS